ncbi:hypothetical protein BC835DRAFT_1391155 [Cytidiella melzeri]|nr:hypothetical protein BC835DRAFT_1391155 [Cytidiella melzeri]
MSRICLKANIPTLRLAQASTSTITRHLHATSQCKSTASLTLYALDISSPPVRRDPKQSLRWKKLQDFKRDMELESVARGRVWSSYVDLLNFLRPHEIPLEVHQQALRRCTTTLAYARYDLVLRMQRKQRIRAVHPHEARFQAIIYNIRQAGYKPSLGDYYFVLQHFAAVGQHIGALQVLREMAHVGLEKQATAYELCFRALYRRLTLPCWHEDRPKLASGISKLVFKLLKEMEQSKMQLTSNQVDLCFRIVGEALEDEPFERLMRLAYGIDLAYPDRPPLEYWERNAPVDTNTDSPLHPLTPFPFTTAALNNTVEFLGRKGRISKLVQAFEVLTSPLTTGASATRDSSYLDDEDEDFGDDRPEVAPFTPPHAEPNTQTFERLIKWISRHNHPSLARHYLYQAYRHDRENARTLRALLSQEVVDLHQVPIPRHMFTSKMLLSVHGLTNREKKLPMMRWTLHMLYRTKHRRRADIIFYRRFVEQRRQSLSVSENQAFSTSLEEFEPSPPVPAPETTSEAVVGTLNIPAAPVLVKKPFSPSLHLSLLRREYSRLLVLERRMTDVVGRTTQRLKERLGRRVWASKDIYLRSQHSRVLITKEQWRTSVNFQPRRPRREDNPEELAALGLPSPNTQFVRGVKIDFFTPSSARSLKGDASGSTGV